MGKKKFEIKDVKVGLDNLGHEYLDSFLVKASDGSKIHLDPMVSGCITEIEEMTADEQVDWGKKQIGKHIFCDEISSQSFVAVGKTYII